MHATRAPLCVPPTRHNRDHLSLITSHLLEERNERTGLMMPEFPLNVSLRAAMDP